MAVALLAVDYSDFLNPCLAVVLQSGGITAQFKDKILMLNCILT
jgi:hypothetical protein